MNNWFLKTTVTVLLAIISIWGGGVKPSDKIVAMKMRAEETEANEMATKGMTVMRQGSEDFTINDPNIANEFDSSADYTAGTYVNYQGNLNRFKVDHPAGSWNANHVEQIKLGDEVSYIAKSINNSFAEPNNLSKVITNVRIVGDITHDLRFNDVRNNYNSTSGFKVVHSDQSKEVIADYSLSGNASGTYVYNENGVSIVFDYDLSKITSGTRYIEENGMVISEKCYNAAVSKYVSAIYDVDGLAGIIYNVHAAGDIPETLTFNDIRNNYNDLTGFHITSKDQSIIYYEDYASFETIKTGHYVADLNGGSISFDYDLTKIDSGSRKLDQSGFDIRKASYDHSVPVKKSFEKWGKCSRFIWNISVISDYRIAIGDMRNHYNGQTGCRITISNDQGQAGSVDFSNGYTGQVSGHYYAETEYGILSFDYDFTRIGYGNRIIGEGLDHLISKDCYVPLGKRFLNSNQETVITVKTDGTGDYTNLRLALEYAATIASAGNPVAVELYEGTYTVNDYYTAEEWAVESTAMIGLIVPDYCTLRGIGSRDNIIVTGSDETKRHYISTINTSDTCGIENITFNSNGLRYAIHDDYSHSDRHSKRVIKNCVFNHENGWYAKAYGAGIHDNDEVILTDCIINSDVEDDYSISFHTNVDFVKGSRIEIDNCRFGQQGLNVITMAEGADTAVKITGTKAENVALTRDSSSIPICVYVTGYANAIDHYTSTEGQASDYFDMLD